MSASAPAPSRAEQLKLLTQTARDSEMGRLLRMFWHPVALSRDVAPGDAIPVRAFCAELTLYRGDTGTVHLVGGRCRHRQTVLHTGWVQGDTIRCMYHGWQYDGDGQCVQRPAEKEARVPPACKIPGYPVREYCGLVFAYLGDGPAPEFDLPRKDVYEVPGALIVATRETWNLNWFQQIENSLDAVHVSFVHQALRVGPFGDAVTTMMPDLSYEENEAGIEQTATRAHDNIRKSDWTFPNNNHVVVPGLEKGDPWIDFGIWMVPQDDEHSTRFTLYVMAPGSDAANERFNDYFRKFGTYNADDHHDELFHQRKGPPEEDFLAGLISAQDYVAQKGQGTIADRSLELLGKSDLGVVTLRRIFWRELDALRNGQPTKQWRKRAVPLSLPTQPGSKPAAEKESVA
ncbi:Rieske 2Fe-2S domain-containing protein [Bordetella sp. BOR01]|uniref:Rieske 2Fe-2S domain-containing protein n=1 Tax=Bordetella sp. BOR01 TaxID=2854779 RepID=UPI002104D60E|nr:Rieske 2Fe-2S domain-containing protein [Bordetella sp. BOR01]